MAHLFSEKQIEEIRQCFQLYADGGQLIKNEAQLRYIMRSVGGYQPTVAETKKYAKEYGHRIDLSSFLEILQKEKQKPDPAAEVRAALEGFAGKRGYVSRRELIHLLSCFGERMSPEEIEIAIAKMGLRDAEMIRVNDFMDRMSVFFA
ncbi:calmodulin [Ditylenchus destructor]|nr:calmodulin [Ditylenchus destructor]